MFSLQRLLQQRKKHTETQIWISLAMQMAQPPKAQEKGALQHNSRLHELHSTGYMAILCLSET